MLVCSRRISLWDLELWSDCLLLPHFADAEVEREKERQLAAIKAEEDNLTMLAYRELRRHLYGEHPYHMSRNGTSESVESLKAGQLRDFHRNQMVAGNAVLAVFGDVRFHDIVDRVGGRLGAFPAGQRRIPAGLPALPDASGKFSEVSKEKKQAVLAVAFPTVDMAHEDRTALDLIDETCSDMASRMFVRIREELGLAYSVGASQMLGMVRGAMVFHLSTAPEQLDFAQEELLKEISKTCAARSGAGGTGSLPHEPNWKARHAGTEPERLGGSRGAGRTLWIRL